VLRGRGLGASFGVGPRSPERLYGPLRLDPDEPPVPFGSMAYDNGRDLAPWCTVEVITESTCQFRVLWLQSKQDSVG